MSLHTYTSAMSIYIAKHHFASSLLGAHILLAGLVLFTVVSNSSCVIIRFLNEPFFVMENMGCFDICTQISPESEESEPVDVEVRTTPITAIGNVK